MSIDTNSLVTIYIDGSAYQVNGKDNLLAGVLSSKLNLPYFCWHPSMGSVGACRQCAVTVYNDENQQQGRLAMACMTPVTDGMYVGLGDNYSSLFREQVIAAMMTNHPHDCPVCAEGGECHLQDMTVMSGHNKRDYVGVKRTFSNQNLGPLIGHEMNRCITCYRCVRYYKDYAGGTDFGVYGSKNQVYFGRQKDGILESEFSGNLVEVCPTGVFTDKPFSAHYARKWDLQSSPSVCKGCAVGCNISVGERYGCVRRVVNRYNDAINGYFLCDKGRFGFGYVNSDDRITQVVGIKQLDQPSLSQAGLSRKDAQISLAQYKGQRFVAIGSERASLETNCAVKHLFGEENFCSGLTEQQTRLLSLNKQLLNTVSMLDVKHIEQADCVLILGEDLTQTSPRIALALRQSVRNAGFDIAESLNIPKWQDEAVRTAAGKTLSPLFICDVGHSKLDDIASKVEFANPDHIAKIAEALNQVLSGVPTSELQLSAEHQQFVSTIIKNIKQAKRPLIIAGHSHRHIGLAEQVLHMAEQFSEVINFAFMPEKANSLGLISIANEQTLTLEQVIQQAQNGDVDGLVIAENELANLTLQQSDNLLNNVKTIIALDHNESLVTKRADVVLPSATFSESQGLLINYQGRAQCFYPAFSPKLPILSSWRLLSLIDSSLGNGKLSRQPASKHHSLTDFWQDLASIESNFPDTSVFIGEQFLLKTARQTHRASGRTAMMANQNVHESKTTQDINSQFQFSMEGGKAQQSPAMPFTWAPGWNSNQSISKFQQQVGGPLAGPRQGVQVFDPKSDIDATNIPAQHLKSINETNTSININAEPKPNQEHSLIFVHAKHIYGNDYLGLKGIEFELLAPIPYVEVSQKLAVEFAIADQRFINLTCNNDNYVTELKITKSLANDCIQVYLEGNQCQQISLVNASLSKATSQQVEAFKHGLNQKLERALSNKKTLLARLKSNDQFIPIRLMAGGLDDL